MKDNLWKVFFWEDGKKKVRKFEGEKPTEAIVYAKELKKKGLYVEVVSGRKAFRPTPEKQLERNQGELWCPYCLKYRVFKMLAIRKESYTTAPLLRCPVCTISTEHWYVRRYNDFPGAASIMWQGERKKKGVKNGN